MKLLYKIFITCAVIISIERLIRTQTHGFRIEKTASDFPFSQEWELESKSDVPSVINQPFYFLDSGVQCYVFLSEDKTTVLKFFKHYHAGFSSTILRKLPLPKFLHFLKDDILAKRQKRMNYIFSSAVLAYKKLPEHTGVFYINLNKKKEYYGKVTLYDKIGIRYKIDLNTTPFLLQKKADRLFSYLENHPKEIPNVIDSLFSCIQNRNQLGIINSDPILDSNFGIHDGKVVEIDIGSFFLRPHIKNTLYSKREIFHETLKFKEWLKTHAPEMNECFEEKLLQATRT